MPDSETKDAAGGYSPAVAKLLSCGHPHDFPDSYDYVAELGLTREHVPELIRMATDVRLWTDSPEGSVAWAGPIHAWRALGQLGAKEAAGPLLACLDDRDRQQDDWYLDEIPNVIALIGPESLDEVERYLADISHLEYPRICMTTCLSRMGKRHPESRGRCVEILRTQLARAEADLYDLNAFLVSALMDLAATEAATEIRQAFLRGVVNEEINGDWDGVSKEMGIEGMEFTPEELAAHARPARKSPVRQAWEEAIRRYEQEQRSGQPAGALEAAEPTFDLGSAGPAADLRIGQSGQADRDRQARSQAAERDRRKRKQARKDRARNRKRKRR